MLFVKRSESNILIALIETGYSNIHHNELNLFWIIRAITGKIMRHFNLLSSFSNIIRIWIDGCVCVCLCFHRLCCLLLAAAAAVAKITMYKLNCFINQRFYSQFFDHRIPIYSELHFVTEVDFCLFYRLYLSASEPFES